MEEYASDGYFFISMTPLVYVQMSSSNFEPHRKTGFTAKRRNTLICALGADIGLTGIGCAMVRILKSESVSVFGKFARSICWGL